MHAIEFPFENSKVLSPLPEVEEREPGNEVAKILTHVATSLTEFSFLATR